MCYLFDGITSARFAVCSNFDNLRSKLTRSDLDQLLNTAKRTSDNPLVVYVIVPNTFANVSHPAAAQVLATISDINSSLRGTSTCIAFHLVPEVFVSHSKSLAHNPTFGMERLVMMVYDSIPRNVTRQYSRLSAQTYPMRATTNAFAFSLAHRQPNKVAFTEKWPPPAASMFDKYDFLHVAYSVASSGEWVSAVAITETGDGQESTVWEVDEHDMVGSIVKGVLDFTLKMTRRAEVEWRVTITKNEAVSAAELDGKSCRQYRESNPTKPTSLDLGALLAH